MPKKAKKAEGPMKLSADDKQKIQEAKEREKSAGWFVCEKPRVIYTKADNQTQANDRFEEYYGRPVRVGQAKKAPLAGENELVVQEQQVTVGQGDDAETITKNKVVIRIVGGSKI